MDPNVSIQSGMYVTVRLSRLGLLSLTKSKISNMKTTKQRKPVLSPNFSDLCNKAPRATDIEKPIPNPSQDSPKQLVDFYVADPYIRYALVEEKVSLEFVAAARNQEFLASYRRMRSYAADTATGFVAD
eukprot:CCRYP_012782-RA/>CCRYP_012782-RA protein AED:0.45 eAED:0.52 QI:300/0/0.33/1/0/0/3/0/128